MNYNKWYLTQEIFSIEIDWLDTNDLFLILIYQEIKIKLFNLTKK